MLLIPACDAGVTSDNSEASAGTMGTSGGRPGAAGSPSAGSPAAAGGDFGTPVQMGQGSSDDRYQKGDVARDNVFYYFMANGWGPGFRSQSVEWDGTSFKVISMQGSASAAYEPASYPTVFCGVYSDSQSRECGLPKAISQLTSVRTGWRWKPNGNVGQYNASYDLWLSNDATRSGHSSYLMVWLRDPPGQQPAGQIRHRDVVLAGVPGAWTIWVGVVLGKPYVAYSRSEGQDTYQLEFDALTFIQDAAMRSISLPGSHLLSVAVGFEIWNGPVSNLVSEDFYVQAQ